MSKPYDAVLFDFDGVLIDSEPVHYQCWKEIFQEMGLDLRRDDFDLKCVGFSGRDLFERYVDIFGLTIDPDDLWPAWDRKQALFRQRMTDPAVVTTPMKDLLAELSVPAALVTSSFAENVLPILEVTGIGGRFAAVVCKDDVDRAKPAPDAYLLAAARVRSAHPLVVEDSGPGVEAAKAAGFDVIRVGSVDEVPPLVRRAIGL